MGTSMTAMLVGTPEDVGGHPGVTATIPRDEIEEALASDQPLDLILDVTWPKDGGVETTDVTVTLAAQRPRVAAGRDGLGRDHPLVRPSRARAGDRRAGLRGTGDPRGHAADRRSRVGVGRDGGLDRAGPADGRRWRRWPGARRGRARSRRGGDCERPRPERARRPDRHGDRGSRGGDCRQRTRCLDRDGDRGSRRGDRPARSAGPRRGDPRCARRRRADRHGDRGRRCGRGDDRTRPRRAAAIHDETSLAARGVGQAVPGMDEATLAARGIETVAPGGRDEATFAARGIDAGTPAATHDEATLAARGVGVTVPGMDETTLAAAAGSSRSRFPRATTRPRLRLVASRGPW